MKHARLGLRAMGISVTRSGAKPAVLVYERGQDSAAVRQNQSLLSERPVVAGSREPVKPRPRPAKANQDPHRDRSGSAGDRRRVPPFT